MKLPCLANFFPANNALAELYGGWLEGPFFKKTFSEDSRSKMLKRANEFLKINGFDINIDLSDFDENNSYEEGSISLDFNTLSSNTLLLIYQQPLMTNPIDSIIELIEIFRTERNWKKFHDSKNLSMAISSEAGELLDLFLWDRDKNIDPEKASNEIADIFIYLLLLSKELRIDVYDSIVKKIECNSKKYPIDKAKGIAKKYDEL